MPKRSKDWNEGLGEQLRDPEFAREFILAARDEGMDLLDILQKVVKAYGVKEFAEQIGMADSNLLRAVSKNANPTQKTLNQILQPFRLKVTIGPILDVA